MGRSRSRFDHLVTEISVEIGALAPRYPLWLRLHELGNDPELLGREGAVAFCLGPLRGFLAEHGFWLSPRARRRVARAVGRFDPTRPAPADRFSAPGADADPGF